MSLPDARSYISDVYFYQPGVPVEKYKIIEGIAQAQRDTLEAAAKECLKNGNSCKAMNPHTCHEWGETCHSRDAAKIRALMPERGLPVRDSAEDK